MAQRARIKLASTEIDKVNQICSSIKEIADKTGVDLRGPIPLPTKKLKVTTIIIKFKRPFTIIIF